MKSRTGLLREGRQKGAGEGGADGRIAKWSLRTPRSLWSCAHRPIQVSVFLYLATNELCCKCAVISGESASMDFEVKEIAFDVNITHVSLDFSYISKSCETMRELNWSSVPDRRDEKSKPETRLGFADDTGRAEFVCVSSSQIVFFTSLVSLQQIMTRRLQVEFIILGSTLVPALHSCLGTFSDISSGSLPSR